MTVALDDMGNIISKRQTLISISISILTDESSTIDLRGNCIATEIILS